MPKNAKLQSIVPKDYLVKKVLYFEIVTQDNNKL